MPEECWDSEWGGSELEGPGYKGGQGPESSRATVLAYGKCLQLAAAQGSVLFSEEKIIAFYLHNCARSAFGFTVLTVLRNLWAKP